MDSEARLRIAHRLALTEAEGPGRRYALWVQGCTLRCPGCCNPELFTAEAGQELRVTELLIELREAKRRHGSEGLTVIGGEPLEQSAGLIALAAGAQAAGLGVIVFTGYTWPEVAQLPDFARLRPTIDTLVSGRFDARRREPLVGGRRFIGSTNQALHHLSDRYAHESLWRGGAVMELKIAPGGELSASGDPQLQRSLLRALAPRVD